MRASAYHAKTTTMISALFRPSGLMSIQNYSAVISTGWSSAQRRSLAWGSMPGEGPKTNFEQGAGHTTRGPVSWTNLGAVAVVSAAAVAYFKIQRERRLEEAVGKIVTTGKPAIGGPWTLIDSIDRKLVSEKSFAGKYTILYFGFTRCPDICPSEMVKVAKVMDMLKASHPALVEKLVPIFVTVDPARDSIRNMKEYAKDFHPSYVFLTGTPGQVQAMAKKYRVYVSKADETVDGDYLVDHSIVLYFHDDKGELLDVCTQSMKPSDIVERIKVGMQAS
mmetsp:Transcript_11893/g.17166  ORF Transcript_11893/g.17166 Transcript_11893/m.17166 type:complete len:278 (+) Transcript_11893:54-887(+)